MSRKSRRERMIAVRKAARRHRRQSDEAELERRQEHEARLEELGLGEDEDLCPDCAEVIKRAARVCKHCGLDLVEGERPERTPRRTSSETHFALAPRKNPGVGALLALIPGLGHVYAGQSGVGLALIACGLVLLVLSPLVLLLLWVIQIPWAASA